MSQIVTLKNMAIGNAKLFYLVDNEVYGMAGVCYPAVMNQDPTVDKHGLSLPGIVTLSVDGENLPYDYCKLAEAIKFWESICQLKMPLFNLQTHEHVQILDSLRKMEAAIKLPADRDDLTEPVCVAKAFTLSRSVRARFPRWV
jgi:hypothetical protein